MADSTLILGLAGIGGAVVAGGFGPSTQRRALAQTVLRGVRMIDLELGLAQQALLASIRRGEWFPPGRVPRFDAWNRFAADIAGPIQAGSWRTLVHAHPEVDRIVAMYEAMSRSDPGREHHDYLFDNDIAADFANVVGVVTEARILVRPINLGGATYHTGTGLWFPETPELPPTHVNRRREAFRRLIRGARQEPPDPHGRYIPMPHGMIFVPSDEQNAAGDLELDVLPEREPPEKPPRHSEGLT